MLIINIILFIIILYLLYNRFSTSNAAPPSSHPDVPKEYTDAIEIIGLTYNLPHDVVNIEEEEAVEIVDEMISVCEVAE